MCIRDRASTNSIDSNGSLLTNSSVKAQENVNGYAHTYENDKNLASKEADDFLISYYGVRHWGERWGPWGTPNEIVRKMKEYIEAGAQHLIVRFASWDQREQFDRFAKEVLPHFK